MDDHTARLKITVCTGLMPGENFWVVGHRYFSFKLLHTKPSSSLLLSFSCENRGATSGSTSFTLVGYINNHNNVSVCSYSIYHDSN